MQKNPTPYFGDLPEEKRHSQSLITFNSTGLRRQPAIYIIENEKTGKIYVGSTRNLGARILTHRRLLLSNQHFNYRLQNSFNMTLFKDVWTVHVGILPTVKKAREREQMIIDESFGHPDLLNISEYVNRPGDPEGFDRRLEKLLEYTRSEKHREMVSKFSKENWKRPAYRENMLSKIGEAVIMDGVRYLSIREASRKTGFSILTIKKRINNGVVDTNGIVKGVKKSVSCEGIIYPSVNDAAANYGIANNTMTYRLKNKASLWKDFFYI